MSPKIHSGSSRRRYLASIASISTLMLSGCITNQEEPNKFVGVKNQRDETVEFRIEFYRVEDEKQVFAEDVSLDPGETKDYIDVFDRRGLKRVVVETEDGARGSFEWTTEAEPTSTTVVISIREEIEIYSGSG